MNKTCTGCRRELPLAAYQKSGKSKDGLQSRCRECRAKWYAANREELLARQKEHRADPEVKARQKKYMAVYQNEYRAKKKAEAAK